MTRAGTPVAAPGILQMLREASAPLEMATFLRKADALTDLPRGDGHPVMFLPGFAMGDEALRPMSRAIERLGYAVHGWNQGRNFALRTRVVRSLLQRVDALRACHAQDVSLVGWSAGGLYAREMARIRPEGIRRIVTLGSPLRSHEGGQATVDRFVKAFASFGADRGDPAFTADPKPPPVPCTAIHSRSDGVVAWQTSLESEGPLTENVEVEGSHLGLGFNVSVLRIIAQRFAADAAAVAARAADEPRSAR